MNSIQSALECRDVSVSFSEPGLSVNVLRGISLRVERGQSLSIVGASGSGKSTLLHTLGGLMTPTAGEVFLTGQALK